MPKQITKVDITNEVFREPIEVIKKLTEHLDDLKFTKVIQTFVMENRDLNLALMKGGSTFLKGKVVWLGNKKDDSEGTVFCIDAKDQLKQVSPTAENSEKVELDIKRLTINISTASKSRCTVCGKDIEIFDEIAGCPICKAKAHRDHLVDWVQMKHSCPICKKALSVSPTGAIVLE